MAKVILKLYRATGTPWDENTREHLIDVSDGLIELKWGYRPASGGIWGGKAKFEIVSGTPAFNELTLGMGGAYAIQWIPSSVADRTITNYTTYANNFLLSFGTYENIQVDTEANICAMDLKGAAEHFEKVLVNLEPNLEQKAVGTIVGDIYDKSITSNGLIRSKSVASVGAALREYNFSEPEAELGQLIKKLQTRAGGENLFGWGVRPSSTLTHGFANLGEAYFEPFRGNDELASSNQKASWFIGKDKVISLQIRRRDSDIKNVISVRSNKTTLPAEGSGAVSSTFFAGTARNAYSVSKFGEREEVIYDSSVPNKNAADDLAAVIAEDKSNPKDEIILDASVPLDGGNQGNADDGKFSGLVQTGLRNGGRTILVEKGTSPAEEGIAKGIDFTRELTGTASLLKINTSKQPSGARAAYPNLKTAGNLADGQQITYVIQGKHPTGSNPAADIAIMELDRQICLGWEYQSGNTKFKLRAKYFNTSSAWAESSGTLSSTEVTWANLQSEHTIYLILEYGTTGVSRVLVEVATASATLSMLGITFSSWELVLMT